MRSRLYQKYFGQQMDNEETLKGESNKTRDIPQRQLSKHSVTGR